MPNRRSIPVLVATSIALAYAALGFARYATFTNRTFDLAFYARMAWGLVRFDFWDPIVGAHVFGLHLSPVLVPIGIVGLAIGTPAALLLGQGLAVGLATVPLARIAERHLGPRARFAALALVLHPNVGHVLSYEAHPGTLAVLPLAWMAEALDRRDARTFLFSALGVLACREDLALVVVVASLVFAAASHAPARRSALAIGALAFAYFAFFVLVLHPMFRPRAGSLEAHFGRWGGSLGEVVVAWLTHPREVIAHLATPRRLSYLPRVTAPLLFLPWLAPRALVVTAPILGVALLSDFPTTTSIESHYLTPALPSMVAASLVGAGVVARRFATTARVLPSALVASSVIATLGVGVLSPHGPLPHLFRHDLAPSDARRLLAHVPKDASVQAPDRFLPHLSERRLLFRAAPPDRGADYLALDLGHRTRFAHSEDLLRTTEEPLARATFARDDLVLVDHVGDYALFRRGTITHEARIASIRLGGTHAGTSPPASGDALANDGLRLATCLSVLDAFAEPGALALTFRAHGRCPNDLALRLGTEPMPARVDLLFSGLVSPSALREGDVVVSRHAWTAAIPETLFVGLLRSSGARPEPDDPTTVRIPVRRALSAPR